MIPAAPRSRARPTRRRSADCGADDGRHRRRLDRVEQGEQVRLGRRTVLEVEDDPVEAGLAAQLGREGRCEVGEHADERFAGMDPALEVGHGVMMPGPRRRPAQGCARYGPLRNVDVSTTSRFRPVMTSSSCMTSSSMRGSLAPVMYQGDPLSARIIP